MNQISLKQLEIKDIYSSDDMDLIQDFYSPIIKVSSKYDRASGYFSNAIFNLMHQDMINFAKRNGKIRLVCSQEVFKDQETIKDIAKGYQEKKQIEESFHNELMFDINDPIKEAALGVIATLIRNDHLEIKIAAKSNLQGIFHEKYGVFTDSLDNQIVFSGSNNETLKGWKFLENSESFSVYTSWGVTNQFVDQYRIKFNNLWENNQNNMVVIPFPEISLDIFKKHFQYQTIQEAFDIYQEIYQKHKNFEDQKSIEPYIHQKRAVNEWKKNDFKGIFKHCTGSGKTFTGILAIKEWIKLNPKSSIIILVPSKILLDSWIEDLKLYFKDLGYPILPFGTGRKWTKEEVYMMTTPASENSPPNISVAIIHTAYKPKFFNAINSGAHLMILGDEVHWFGAEQYQNLLSLTNGGCLGLSATPERNMDPDGTGMIMDYFNGIVDEYKIRDAIKDKILSKYNYFPYFTELNQQEIEEYNLLTQQIKKLYAVQASNKKVQLNSRSLKIKSNSYQHLLFKRADIVKNAENKIELACNIIKEKYNQNNHESWIVYCDDKIQLDNIFDKLKKMGYQPDVYYSGMEGDQAETLNHFEVWGGILISIKCLDEGVNIPSVDNALIIASSTNPREYIQRRGRILRKAKNKTEAKLYDILITPQQNEFSEPSFNILKGELNRALNFSKDAENHADAYLKLIQIANKYGILTTIDTGIDQFGTEVDKNNGFN